MKTLLALFAILTSLVTSAQSIEISPNGGTANASAILDLKSTTKGFLLPRMTNAQMRAIPSPAQGLLAFCTDCGTNGDYYFYKGTTWVALGFTTVSVSTTVGSVSANANENGATITNGGVLSLAPADATNPGIVSTTTQTIAGAKTFSADLSVNGLTVGKGTAGIATNTAIGISALGSNTTGYHNIANGYQALYSNTEGYENTATGFQALYSNTTANSFFGVIKGRNNTANGFQALYSNTTGSFNTANGNQALYSNTTGGNTANGYQALYSNTTGNENTANGSLALYSNITGDANTATGNQALRLNTTGVFNTATGDKALRNNTTGDGNTAYGRGALSDNQTGAQNTAIGNNASVSANNLTNATAIGNGAVVNASNKIQMGDGNVTAVQLGTGTNVTLETGLVKITGGTPGAGKVLTSDAAGLASWISPSSSGVDLTTTQTITGVKTFSNGIVANVTGNVTGNAATVSTNANLTGVVTSTGNATSIANGAISNAMLANTAVANLSGINTGDQTLPTLSSLGAVASNTAITSATNTKITYDAKGLVTAGAAATTADIAASTNKNYVTDAQKIVISNTSGTNTGDNAVNNLYSGLEGNATHTGDVTGSTALTIANNAVTTSKILDANVTDAKISSVSATKITGVLPVFNGGTGSSTKDFVDITTTQRIAGAKTFSSDINVNGITVGRGKGSINNNIATGLDALYSNTSGSQNTANGWRALYNNTAGSYNVATGVFALESNTTGSDNTAIGIGSQSNNTTGSNNTAIGKGALNLNTTGSQNTAIGRWADVASNNLTNATAIGAGAIVTASNKVRIGDVSVTVIEGQVAWSNASDRRLKENIQVNNNLGLNFINRLQPVTYNYISDNTKVRHDGFIAQDIEQVMRDLNLPFSGLKKSNDGMYSLAYSDFVMPLVNAVKEQKTMIDNQQIQIGNQHQQIDKQQKQIDNQQLQIDELKKMVESMLKK